MTAYEMLKQSIEFKIQRNALTESFITNTKKKMSVFKQAGKLDAEQEAELLAMLKA